MAGRRSRPADELIELARILLLIQGAVGFVAMVEVGVVAAATGGVALPAFVLTAFAAVLTLALSIGIRRRWRRARATASVLQVLWLVGAAIDLLLAVFLARRGLEMVPLLTRVGLPLLLLRILRRPQVRDAFGARPRRRDRRRMRRTATPVETAPAPPASEPVFHPMGVAP